MSECKCCGEVISEVQTRWSGLCSLCDMGACQSPEKFHELHKKYKELQAKYLNHLRDDMEEINELEVQNSNRYRQKK